MPVKSMSARFNDKLYEEILEHAREKGIPKTRALRELTKEGVKKWRLTKALALYREGRVTVWKASHIAGVPLSRMIEVATSEKIPVHYGREDLQSDFKNAFGETV